MNKNPLRTLGVVFSSIAAVELAVLLLGLPFLLKHGNSFAVLIFSLVLTIQILVFGGIGLGFLLHLKKKAQKRESLLANGYCELAVVRYVEPVLSVRISGQHPYRVICIIDRGGVLHEYHSDMLMENPFLKPGDPVRVYLDRQNEDSYYVDVESASPTVIRHG